MKSPVANIPYVPVVGFEKAVHALRHQKAGEPMNKLLLEKKGITGNTYYQVINALKFLRIIDKGKLITPNLELWLKDREGKLKIVNAAYKPLLAKLTLPAKDNSQVKKGIKELYDMADSVVLLSTTFFTWVARQAGINVLEGDHNGIPRRGRGAKPGLSRSHGGYVPRGRVASPRPERPPQPNVVFHVNLQITKDTKPGDIRRILAELKQELTGF